MNKQDRQGVRTPAQLEEKYNFGKSFAEIMGIATDAQTAAEKANENTEVVKTEVIRLDEQIKLTAERVDGVESQTSVLSLSASGILGRVEQTEQQLLTKADASELETVSRSLTEVEQTASDLKISVQTLSGTVAGKADQEALTEVTEHFRFASDGMTISNTATGMGINVSEQQVAFIGGQDPTTIIRPNDMETTNLQVKTQMDLGGFSFIPRSNQNLSLRWTGGNT